MSKYPSRYPSKYPGFRIARLAALFAILSFAGGCSAIDRLSQIGEQPKLNPVENSNINDFIGAKTITQPLKVLPGNLLATDSTSSADGKGSINRQEALQTNVAAVVTQVLANGNLVVEGKQEIRVNYEIRELIVAGIVRPEDIQSDNTIDSSKIAQARIAYGGRGQITDVQQPRYGQQVMDVILPF